MASLNAEHTAISNAMYGRYPGRESVDSILYINKEGSAPKLTMSAIESSSLPIGEDTFNMRAAKPSKKSNRHAAQTKYAVST